jgi:hypothetical protein
VTRSILSASGLLAGKVAVITGAGAGVGKGTVGRVQPEITIEDYERMTAVNLRGRACETAPASSSGRAE